MVDISKLIILSVFKINHKLTLFIYLLYIIYLFSQQDAHEFLTDLITILEHGYLRILKNKLKGTKYMSELENVIEVNENSTSNNTNSPTKSIKTISISESSESSSSLLSSSITIGTNSEKNQSQENNEINNQIKIPYLVNLLVPTTRRFLSIMDISLRCTSCNKIRHKKVIDFFF